ncbi:MAG: Gfo/Idh/MocA family oxidoreductase [Acidimicrobiia bacterium]|nr:Gfo/Idh/MocA family oxidoreductase [Acidimicrobiia bacterium]
MPARVGVIGTGWWATRAHLPAIAANPDAELVAIADPNEANRNRAAEAFAPPSVYGDHREMLRTEQLDGVVVAVPHTRHFDIARDALQADLHVLVEKPMVLTSGHARELLQTAAEHDRQIIVGYPWHYNDQVDLARDWIASGAIGDLLYVHSLFASIVWELYRGDVESVADEMGYTVNPTGRDTYSDPALSGGGQGVTQITHSGALLLHMTGLEPTEVFAQMHNHDLQVDLVDALSVRFENGCLGTIGSTGSTVRAQEEVLEYRLYGTGGHILFDVMHEDLTMYRADGSITESPPCPPAPAGRDYSTSYPEEGPLDNLVEVIGGGPNRSPGRLGARVVAMLEAAYASAADGLSHQVAPTDP